MLSFIILKQNNFKFEDVNINVAYQHLQAVAEEKTWKDKTINLIIYLKVLLDKPDVYNEKIIQQLAHLDEQVIEIYAKKGQPVPTIARTKLLHVKLSLLGYACSNLKSFASSAILQNIRSQLGLLNQRSAATDEKNPDQKSNNNSALVVEPSNKVFVVDHYKQLIAIFDKDNPAYFKVITLLEDEIYNILPSHSILPIPKTLIKAPGFFMTLTVFYPPFIHADEIQNSPLPQQKL